MDVLTAERGPEADINLVRKRFTQFREDQRFLADKADIGEGQILTPKKKPKGRSLTSEEKENNRILSKRRIYIEHLIRRVKIFRVVQERFRLRATSYPIAILTVCGLTRLRMGTLKWAYFSQRKSPRKRAEKMNKQTTTKLLMKGLQPL